MNFEAVRLLYHMRERIKVRKSLIQKKGSLTSRDTRAHINRQMRVFQSSFYHGITCKAFHEPQFGLESFVFRPLNTPEDL